MKEKNIKCILDERDVYGIFQQYLNKLKWFTVAIENKDEIDVICDVRKAIIKKLGEVEDFKKFIPILQNLEPENKTVKRIKKNRR